MYYAINCLSSNENNLINEIKLRINHDCYDDVFTPTRGVMKKVNGEWIEKTEIVFPGYVFVSTNNIKELSNALLWIPEFARVLGRDKESGDFVALSVDECRYIDLLCGKENNYKVSISDIAVKEGKQIRVLSGPLMGFKGKITKVDLHKRCVYCSLDIMNRKMDVKLGINIVSEDI